MNKYYLHLFKLMTSSITYKLIIFYLVIGTFFIINFIMNESYLNTLSFAITNLQFISLVVCPVFILMTYKWLEEIEKNECILLRLESKKKYLKMQIIMIIFTAIFMYVQMILLMLIFMNISSRSNLIIEKDIIYNVPNILTTIGAYIKVLLFIINLQIVHFIFFKSNLQKSIGIIIEMILVIGLFRLVPHMNNNIISYILPSTYFTINDIFPTYYSNVIYSLLYFVSWFIVLLMITRKTVLKGDFYRE